MLLSYGTPAKVTSELGFEEGAWDSPGREEASFAPTL